MHADEVTIPHLSTNSKHRIFHASPTALYIAAAAVAGVAVIVAAVLSVVLLLSLCYPVALPLLS